MREIILHLAGETAEVVFFGEAAPRGSAYDSENAMTLATRMSPVQKEAEAFVAWLQGYGPSFGFCPGLHLDSRRDWRIEKENAGQSSGVHDIRVHLEIHLRRTSLYTPLCVLPSERFLPPGVCQSPLR